MPIYKTPNMMPDWADPAQASVMDPLYKTLARRAVSTLGLDDPNTAVTSLMNPMAAAEGPAGTVIGDMLQSIPGKAGQAAEALVNHLNSFKLPRVTKKIAGATFSKEAGIGSVPTPTNFRTILNRTITRVPEIEDQFTAPSNKVLSRPTELSSKYRTQAAVRAKLTPSIEDQLSSDIAKGVYERPSVTSPDQLQDIVPSGTQTDSVAPRLLGAARNGSGNNQATAALAKTKLSEDDIRAIRGMTKADSISAYPKLTPETLRGIRTRDTFGWIKD